MNQFNPKDIDKLSNESVMMKIERHERKHIDCCIDMCPMIITKDELIKLLFDEPTRLFISDDDKVKLLTIDSGFIGTFSGVPLYLFKGRHD